MRALNLLYRSLGVVVVTHVKSLSSNQTRYLFSGRFRTCHRAAPATK